MKIKFKKKYLLFGLISGLLLTSPICIVISRVINHSNSTKDNTVLNAYDNYNNTRLSASNDETTSKLIDGLKSVAVYTDSYVITNQRTLMYSILGNKTGDKKSRISQLAWFNKHSLIKKNRFSKQVKATIINSNKDLSSESVIINKIVSIIQNHPDTYKTYLNAHGYIIPNLDFFISNIDVPQSKILPLKANNILNSTFAINKNNININSISNNIEESTVGIFSAGKTSYGILDSVFQNINFRGRIMTFDSINQKYKFAKSTSIINNNSNINLSEKNLSKSDSLEISKSNLNNSYVALSLYTNKNTLTELTSLNIGINLHDLSFPSNFNYRVAGISYVNYNSIMNFSNNIALYSSLISTSLVLSLLVPNAFILEYKMKKLSRRYFVFKNKQINEKFEQNMNQSMIHFRNKANDMIKTELNRINEQIQELDVRNSKFITEQSERDAHELNPSIQTTYQMSINHNHSDLLKKQNKDANNAKLEEINADINSLDNALRANGNKLSPEHLSEVNSIIRLRKESFYDLKKRFAEQEGEVIHNQATAIVSENQRPINLTEHTSNSTTLSSTLTRNSGINAIENVTHVQGNLTFVEYNAATDSFFDRIPGESFESAFTRMVKYF